MLILFISLIFIRTLAFQSRQIILERERQSILSSLNKQMVYIDSSEDTFTLRQRLSVCGIKVNTSTQSASPLMVNQEYMLLGENAETRATELHQQVPVCNSIQELITFPWLEVIAEFPKPIFSN